MNTKFLLLTCIVLSAITASGQTLNNSSAWDAANKRWTGPTTVALAQRWTFTARTGYDNVGAPGVRTSPYYVSDNVNGWMEYLPMGYNPANTSKRYSLLIYFPGCGETGNTGFFYTNASNNPRYDIGLARLFGSSGNFPSLPWYILQNGQYFSKIKIKRPADGIAGAVQNAGVDVTDGMIILCVNYLTTGFCSGAVPPSVYDMETLINKAISLYRVDPAKVFVTGMSQGGPIEWSMASFSDYMARYLAGIIPVCATGTIYNPNQAIQDASADVVVRNGLNVLAVSNRLDYNNDGIGGKVHVYNRASMLSVLANPGLKPYQADTSFFTYTSQQAWLDNPVGSPPYSHNAWQFAYHPAVVEYSASIPTNIQGNQKVWRDIADGDNYNLFEWMITRQNLLVLPVRLAGFTARQVDGGVKLDWTSATEINSSHFEIERSTDGRNFSYIGQVAAAGTSSTDKGYTYLDANVPAAKEVYYRLKQVDKDNRFEYSQVKKVILQTKPFDIKLYPNTTTGPVTMEFKPASSTSEFKVVDMNGRVMMRSMIKPRERILKFDISTYATGIYMIQLSNENDVETMKLIKR